MEAYPDRATRDAMLDAWMRNLPQAVRDAMATLGMSEQEYRNRIEVQLFGYQPNITVSGGTITAPVITWQDMPTCWGTSTIATPVQPWHVIN